MKTMRVAVVVCAFASGFAGQSVSAQQLIAVGQLTQATDLNAATAGPLENGAPGNMLGGIGSGLAYAGGDTFLALPDRGPNGGPFTFNACLDETASYINRFQTVQLRLTAGPGLYGLPFTLTPNLQATTLLWSAAPLVYGDGAACGVVSGAPALNTSGTHYFTGRSDNFNASQPSTDPNNARFDTEGIRVAKNGQHVYISDEYGPYVYRFNRATGKRDAVYTLPPGFAVTNLSSIGAVEISSNHAGRVANKGMEGLAITPDGSTLVGIMQSGLIQDGGDAKGQILRIVAIDTEAGATTEYAYPTDLPIDPSTGKTFKTAVSEIVAVNSHVFLVDERDGAGLGDGSTALFKKLYLVDLAGAQDVSADVGKAALAAKKLKKYLFMDLVAKLSEGAGIAATDVPAKIEGMAFGPDVDLGADGVKHTLYIANDNDFSVATSGPNQFFVFAFTDTELGNARASDGTTLGTAATFVPQTFTKQSLK
jgi:hypothetical protein